MFLRQSTASQEIELGPFFDDTDFKTAETGLTIANTDIKLRKGGGTTHISKNSGGGTHIANGYYYAVLDATDTDTVGLLEVHANIAGALAVWDRYYVLEEVVFDALYAASAPGYLQPTTAGRTLDVSATGEAGIDFANIGAPTTTVNLSGTTIKAVTDPVDANIVFYDGNLPPALISGNYPVQVVGMNTAVLTPDAINTSTGLQPIRSNIAQAGAAGTITLDASASALDDFYNGCIIYLTAQTGIGQTRLITDYNGTTKVATITPNWITNPSSNSNFAILPKNRASIGAWQEVLPNALISGRVDSNVQAIANAVLTNSAFAAGALDAAALATDAAQEIADALLDRSGAIETGLTPRQALRLIASATAGKLSGAATTTVTINNAVQDSKARITATVDSDGNRSAVIWDVT